jgi:hypothetical protein
VIFLDTNVVSELLRARPDPGVLGWSDGLPREEMCIASVVEAELRAGVERLPDGRASANPGGPWKGSCARRSRGACSRSTAPPPPSTQGSSPRDAGPAGR